MENTESKNSSNKSSVSKAQDVPPPNRTNISILVTTILIITESSLAFVMLSWFSGLIWKESNARGAANYEYLFVILAFVLVTLLPIFLLKRYRKQALWVGVIISLSLGMLVLLNLVVDTSPELYYNDIFENTPSNQAVRHELTESTFKDSENKGVDESVWNFQVPGLAPYLKRVEGADENRPRFIYETPEGEIYINPAGWDVGSSEILSEEKFIISGKNSVLRWHADNKISIHIINPPKPWLTCEPTELKNCNFIFLHGTNYENLKKLLGLVKTLEFADGTQSAVQWQAYINKEYGFQVKYMPDWLAVEDSNGIYFISRSSYAAAEENRKKCENSSPQNQCAPEFYTESVNFTPMLGDPSPHKTSEGKRSFNGVSFNIYKDGGLFGWYYDYETLNRKGVSLVFNTDEGNLKYLEQILSTFEFMK